MKVRSPLADMDVGVGAVSRNGNDLVLTIGPGQLDRDRDHRVRDARCVRHARLKCCRSPAGLLFVSACRCSGCAQTFGHGSRRARPRPRRTRPVDINKPW